MIRIKNLSLSVKGRALLNDISLTLEEGRIYALLGENGSGKTTLMRVLSSYFRSYSGSIEFGGRELRTLSRKERDGMHSLLPQLLPQSDISVRCLLSMYRNGLACLESLGLGHLKDSRLNVLSGGEKEMVFLALAISHDAALYLLDEPEASLDSNYRKKTERVMMDLAEQGKTVLVSFHDITRAVALSDDVIVLSRGSLAFFGSKDEFISSDTAERIFSLSSHTLDDGRVVFI